MRTHLAEAQLVELAERGQSHPHLARCERCRVQVEELRALLDAAGDVAVPEPSPAFWDQLAARVAQSVRAEERAPAVRAWPYGATWNRAALVAAALLVIAVVTWRSGVLAPGTHFAPVPRVAASVDTSDGGEPLTAAADDDETWALVTGAASGLDLEAATSAGFDLQPGSAEAAAAQLSPDEQRELVRLLRAAVAQPGS